jgi:threonine dehydratase
LKRIEPSFESIQIAADVLRGVAHLTPVMTSQSIDRELSASFFFKCENFQRVGAFKFRGAYFAISQLTDEEKSRGVVSHSSGNHGQAVALAASMAGIPAWIVMPENAPIIKKKGVRAFGGTIVECESSQSGRESMLAKVAEETGAHYIPPYDDARVISGQGTCALELLNQVEELDIVMAPVGGGGLISGSALSVKHLRPECKVIGAEPEHADDAFRSFREGSLQPLSGKTTIADGLRASLGKLPFQIIHSKVDEILTVKESSIIEAMRLIWERMKIIIEPSCAVPLAAVMDHPERFRGQRVGILLTGGNVDLDRLPWNLGQE